MEAPKKEMLLTHVAKDFSSLSGYRYGQETMCANIKWQIGYRLENQDVGVYLFCRHPKTPNIIWSATTNFSIRLLSVNGNQWSIDFSYTFANDSEFSGFGHLFSFDTLLKEYVVDDTLIIEVEATIETVTGIEKPMKKRSFEKSTDEPSDVILKVAEEKFHVTKGHLVAQSEYFKKLLMGKFKEGNQEEVELKEIDPDAFQVFLEVIYMEDALTDDNIEEVLKLVDMYDAKNVARVCEQFLMCESKLSMRTKLQIAGKFKFEKLKKNCVESLVSLADVRAVMASDSSHLDASICHVLLEKLITLKL